MEIEEAKKLIFEAETLRASAGGEASSDPKAVKQIYEQSAAKFQSVVDAYPRTPEELRALDPETQTVVGQSIWSVATVYTSLAKHASDEEQEIRRYLTLAQQAIDDARLQVVYEAMNARNLGIDSNPIVWGAEIYRIRARIQERQPNATSENFQKAREYYTQAMEIAWSIYLSAVKQRNRKLQLGALSAYTTPLIERAKIRPPEEIQITLSEMAAGNGLLAHLYQELPNFDRTETVLARTIDFCLQHEIPENHPVFAMTVALFLDLVSKGIATHGDEAKNRFAARLQMLKEKYADKASQLISSLESTLEVNLQN